MRSLTSPASPLSRTVRAEPPQVSSRPLGFPAGSGSIPPRLTVAQVADGVTVVKVLLEAGAEGWDLASVMDGGDKRVILMRRPKRSARQSRRVGFAPPANN